MHTPAHTLLRIGAVLARYGCARPTLYEIMADGLFPRPIKLGPKFVAWVEEEINVVIAARIAGKSAEAIRALVVELIAARSRALDGYPQGEDCSAIRRT